jgi:hypothetical protein
MDKIIPAQYLHQVLYWAVAKPAVQNTFLEKSEENHFSASPLASICRRFKEI